MTRWMMMILAILFAGTTGHVACDDGGGDGDSDADSDGDADGDSDADSDTEAPQDVACDALPTDCIDIGSDAAEQEFGCCFDNVVYTCINGTPVTVDCNSNGTTCAYSEDQDRVTCVWDS